jgi:hypothetical protein
MTDPYLAARGFTDATVERAGLRVEPIGERTKRYGLPRQTPTPWSSPTDSRGASASSACA